ncbi:prepilin-type N-terminal cleavage/methylation domain-containing protein [Opitutaceae bacterium TAV1]|nr:prepilin-type N-terminal cleavage/methylation domain-containing protein [Opitutaceae bacterium TAV1]
MKTNTRPFPASVIRRSGFTLIELLTVVAIIGILAAIIIPTVGSVRRSARAIQCKSNMRQLGMAILQYADENRGLSPISKNPNPDYPKETSETISWWQLMQKRLTLRFPTAGVDNLFLCPDAKTTFTVAPRRTYALNLAGADDTDPVTFSRLSAPSQSILLVEAKQNGTEGDSVSVVGIGSITRGEFDWRHKGETMNVAFADGSVRTLKSGTLTDGTPSSFETLLRNIRK